MADETTICVNSSGCQTGTISFGKDPSNITRSCCISSKRINVDIITVDIRDNEPITLAALTQIICNYNLIS